MRPTEDVILRAKIDHADVPDSARDMLYSLLAHQPNKRPASAAKVREWVEWINGEGIKDKL